MKLKDKTAIVTGAGKGIGAEIARQLAREGVAVTVNYARDENAARQVVLEIERAGGRAVAVQADIGAPAGMPAVFDAAEAAFGPVDILVNNAGLMRLSSVADATDKDIEDHCAINLAGTFRGMREGARRLRDGGGSSAYRQAWWDSISPATDCMLQPRPGSRRSPMCLPRSWGRGGLR